MLHKPGPLKQQNKSHKHGRHRTKGEIDKSQKGIVHFLLLHVKCYTLYIFCCE